MRVSFVQIMIGLLLLTLLVTGAPADTRLSVAAMNGDTTAVQALLGEGIDVNAAQGDGTTALHWAAYNEDPETAACKFYITLSKAPFLDQHFTVFAKVTAGLDVARKIFTLPVRNDAEFPEGDRPEKPVVIRKVTIQTKVEN